MTLNWSARSALRLYPQSWRDEHHDEVVGTLLDVAESNDRAQPPISEVLPLALRGAWMRARSSVVFWAGIVIIVAMLWTLGSSFDGFLSERYLTTMVTRAGTGLPLALPVAGATSAWLVSRRRPELPVAIRLRGAVAAAGWSMIPVLMGYLASVIAQVFVSGLPLSLHLDATVLLAFLGMSLVAASVGALAGALLPRFVAAPLALGALGYWFIFASTDAYAGSVSGVAITQSAPTLYRVPGWNAVVACLTLGLAAAAVVILVLAVLWMRGRVAAAVVAALGVVALAMSWSPLAALATTGVEATRSESHLSCSGDAPTICLWPEQEAESGALVRETVSGAYARGIALGLPMPGTVSVAGSEDNPHPLFWRGTATGDRVLTNYAQAFSHQFACEPWIEWSEEKLVTVVDGLDMGFASAEYAMAVALGADLDAALPTVQIGGDASEPATKTLNPEESREYLGVHSVAEAEALAIAWVEAGTDCS